MSGRFYMTNAEMSDAASLRQQGYSFEKTPAFEQGFRQSYYVWIRQWVLYACACVSYCCTYGSSWAAAPFMLIAHFGMNYFLGSLEIHASARWLVGGAHLGCGSWLGWRGLVAGWQCYLVY